jgi:hypothetical protein
MTRIYQALLAAVVFVSTTAFATEFKYSNTPNFFEANPGGQPIGPCHGGAVIDKAGNIYITTDTERGILVFSPEGKFLRAFGPTRIHGLELRREKGVDVEVTVPNSEGRVRSGMIAALDVAQPNLPGAEPSTLPLAAIVRSPQNPQQLAVYVAEDDSGRTIARLRRVNLGPIVGNEIAVSSGVRTGEQVIIRGATMVTDGSEVRVIP